MKGFLAFLVVYVTIMLIGSFGFGINPDLGEAILVIVAVVLGQTASDIIEDK